jgi:hypothetical protein
MQNSNQEQNDMVLCTPQQHKHKSHQEREQTFPTNRICSHFISTFVVAMSWMMVFKVFHTYCVRYFLSSVVSNIQNIAIGTLNGTHCTIWNVSPYQHARCAMVSHANQIVTHFTSSIYTDMQKIQSFPTLCTFVFSTSCALYFFFKQLLKTLFDNITRSLKIITTTVSKMNIYIYSNVYQVCSNPLIPFEYIERAIHATN